MSDFRKRLLCIPKNNSRLPKEYKEVEYIEGTGTQYLSTGYVVNQNSVIDIKLMLTTQYSGRRFLFGSSTTNSNMTGGCALTGYNAISPIYYYGIYYANGSSMSLNTVNVIKAKKSGITINGTTYSVNPSNPSATVPLYIFNINMGGTAGGTSGYACVPMRLYYFTISENDVIIKDFVPCYRKSDGVIGMYDTVGGVFITNLGTGTFTKGADV